MRQPFFVSSLFVPTTENETLSKVRRRPIPFLIVVYFLTLAFNNYYCVSGMSSSDTTTTTMAPPVVIPDEPRSIDTSVSAIILETVPTTKFTTRRFPVAQPFCSTMGINLFLWGNDLLTHVAGSFMSLLYFSYNQERDYPTEYEGHFERLVITREEILQRVHDLGKEINQDYAGRRPVLLCVLKGANPVRVLLNWSVSFS
jgi:hypothetical protein